MKYIVDDWTDVNNVKRNVYTSLTNAKTKTKTLTYYRIHKCYHDENTQKPCEIIEQKKNPDFNNLIN